MTDIDDELARALREVRVGEYAPIERLRDRAGQVRARRRLAGAGLTVAAAVLVAVPSALALGDGSDDGAEPAPAASGPAAEDCPVTYADAIAGKGPDPVAQPADVPETLRLLWPAAAAPAPDLAFAEDATAQNAAAAELLAGCPDPGDQSVLVVQVEDDVVTRSVLILRVDPESVGLDEATTLTVDDVEVHLQRDGGFVTAAWESGGETWALRGDPLSDDELAELIRTMRTDDGRIDVGDWSVADGAEQLIEGTGRMARPGDHVYTVSAPDLRLTVTDEDDTIWLDARPGSHVTEVGGRAAIFTTVSGYPGGRLTWQPADGVTATLEAFSSEADQLAIAETVAVAPADDPRLAAVWALGESEPHP